MKYRPGDRVWAKLGDGLWWAGEIVIPVVVGLHGATTILGGAAEQGYVVDLGRRAVCVEERRIRDTDPGLEGLPTEAGSRRRGRYGFRMEVVRR